MNKKELKQLLISKNIKPTFQRIKILEYLLSRRTHPDAETTYNELIKEIPTISKTTIYNTLREFSVKGLILSIPCGNKLCFDGYTQNHYHFICESCGTVYDVDFPCPEIKKKRINGHLVEEFCGFFKGRCKNCIERSKV